MSCVTESPSAAAQRLLVQAADALLGAASSSSDAELVALLGTCESVVRRLDRVTVDAVAALDRRGVFAEHGYRSPVQALSDLLGWERFEARRRVVAAEQVTPRTGFDGAVLRPGCRHRGGVRGRAGRGCGTSR
jgi:5-methylcytosine-specific restriction protein A